MGKKPQINKLLEDEHFGLVGMIERAALINAHPRIKSQSGRGTMVMVIWPSKLSRTSVHAGYS